MRLANLTDDRGLRTADCLPSQANIQPSRRTEFRDRGNRNGVSHVPVIARWNRVTDLWRGGYRLSLDNASFRAVAKRTVDVSRGALDTVRNGVLSVARNSLAFVLSRPLGAAVVVTTLSTSTFCGVGYVHYKHAASAERVAAQRAERANADLQDALDRLRDELAATMSRIGTPGDNGKGQTAASEPDNIDRVELFTRSLEQPHDLQLTDPQRPTWAVSLSWEPRSHSSLDQNQVKLQQLSAERDEAAGERDQLRARVSELEQELSLLRSRRGPRPVANAATVRPVPPGQAPEAEAAIASAPAIVQAPEHPRQVAVVFPTKNFTPPGWAPSNFSNESAPIRGNPTRRPAEANAKE
jgi:hypothetical protein